MIFVSHSILEKYFVQCFGICVQERKRTGGMQETQQYNSAMWCPPLNNLRPPTIVHNIHQLLLFCATEFIHLTQRKAQITCLHSHVKIQRRNTGNRTFPTYLKIGFNFPDRSRQSCTPSGYSVCTAFCHACQCEHTSALKIPSVSMEGRELRHSIIL